MLNDSEPQEIKERKSKALLAIIAEKSANISPTISVISQQSKARVNPR